MRRLGLVLAVLALAGCEGVRDAFSAHADVAARAGGQPLTVERLTELALRLNRPPRQQTLARLANVYVDYTLFALQVAEGRALDDSTTVLKAQWPIVSELKWARFQDRLTAGRRPLTPAQVDSVYRAGDLRLFQHLLIEFPSGGPDSIQRVKRAQMERLRRQASGRAGAQFAQLAARYSEDPGSKPRGGYLGIAERGQYVPPFEEAAWGLEPGALSGVVQTSFGFHLIRRPLLAEVRDSFRVGVESRLAARFDSIYVDSLARRRQVEVKKEAPALVRRAMEDLDAARDDGRTLVTFRGGRLRMRDVVRWVFALPPDAASAIPLAPEDQIVNFLRAVTHRHLLLLQADSAGVGLTPEDWGRIRVEYDSTLASLQAALGISPALFRDSASTAAERARLAAAHAVDYLDRVVRGSAPYVPVPPPLGDVLRERGSWSVSAAGLRRAAERAGEARRAADSARAPRGPLQPAPGPAPVPSADTAPAERQSP